jgi:hypothetical protein
MLFGKSIATYFDSHTKSVNTVSAQNTELLNVQLRGTVHRSAAVLKALKDCTPVPTYALLAETSCLDDSERVVD